MVNGERKHNTKPEEDTEDDENSKTMNYLYFETFFI